MRHNPGSSEGRFSGSAATAELRKTIETFNTAATKQAAEMIRLTWILVALTIVLTVGLGVQLAVAFDLIGAPQELHQQMVTEQQRMQAILCDRLIEHPEDEPFDPCEMWPPEVSASSSPQ